MTETELIFMVLDNENALSRKEIVDKLNDFNDENERLKKENENLKRTIDCICEDYEIFHGMDIRNAEWFTAW